MIEIPITFMKSFSCFSLEQLSLSFSLLGILML